MNANSLKPPLLWLGMILFVGMSGFCVFDAWHLVNSGGANQPLILTSIMMVGFALVVALVILLLIFFKATGTEDKTQALGLPSGSVRALIAFSLVLMFVCVGVYLYQKTSTNGDPTSVQSLNQDQVNELKAEYSLVIVHPSNPVMGDDNKPRFDVTYYPGHSKDADDLAKQMFTQLATVFVTVIGFYFGSSTTSSGVGAGVAAASAQSGKTPPANAGVPGALMELKATAHDADGNLDRIKAALAQVAQDASKSQIVQSCLDDAQKAIDAIHANVQMAADAAANFGTASTDAENNAFAADVLRARDAVKALAVSVKANVDKVASEVPSPT